MAFRDILVSHSENWPTNFGLLFPVVFFLCVFDQSLAEQLRFYERLFTLKL